MIIITHISYHIISPTQNYLSNKVPMMIPGDCNPCHRSHKNGGFTQFQFKLFWFSLWKSIKFEKNIIRRFTEAVWDALEAGWPVLASFSSREIFDTMTLLWRTKISVKKDLVKTDYGADDKALNFFKTFVNFKIWIEQHAP